MLFSLTAVALSLGIGMPVTQGETLVLPLTPQACQASISVFDRTYECRPDNAVVIGVDLRQEPGVYILTLDGTPESVITVFPRVQPPPRKLRRRTTACKIENPHCAILRVRREREVQRIVHALQSRPSVNPVHTVESKFRTPLPNITVTAPFGEPRLFGRQSQWHLGVDLRAPYRTPVAAIGPGLVVMAGHSMIEGKMVIVYHGDGVYSLYLHLWRFSVKPGQMVQTGDIIGRSGDSGARGQPHLHFAVKVNGAVVDPLAFIETINQ